MKRAILLSAALALMAPVLLAVNGYAALFSVPFVTIPSAAVLPTGSGEAPEVGNYVGSQTNDGKLPGGVLFYRVYCDDEDLVPDESTPTSSVAFYMLNICEDWYDTDGTYQPYVEVWVRFGDFELFAARRTLPPVIITKPVTDVSIVDFAITSGLEPHDPTFSGRVIGPAGAVDLDVSCNGDDGVYEVQSADTDNDFSSQECAAISVTGANPAIGTVCVRATIGAAASPKACGQFTTTPQVITPGALVTLPTSGPEPLDDVALSAIWSTNGGLVDLQFKADDSAGCPASPGDDADCFQVEDVATSSYNTLTQGGATFDYASDGTYQPQVTITDADGAAAAVTIATTLVVTPVVVDPDPVFGIRFAPASSACQRDAATGTCSVAMDPVCTGDAQDDITAGALACGSGGTADQGTVLPYGSVGANLDSWSAHATGMIWCDRMKTATYDAGTGGWGARLGATGVTHNSDKYPTAWTDGDGGADANVGVFINRELDVLNVPDGVDPNPTGNIGHYPTGTYTLICTGNATLDLQGDASGADCACPNTCTYSVTTPTEGGILVVAKTPFTSGTPDVDIRGPDACVGDVRSSWLEQVASLSSLRNIGGRRINETPPTTLATRTLPSRYSYSNSTDTTVATVPIEVEVAMNNAAHTDLYLNFPDAAADDLVAFELDYVANNLTPGLRVRVADGNEIWNGAGIFGDAKNRHDAAGVGLCVAPCDEWFHYQMKRSMELWALCEAEMGDDRCINVLEIQNADPTRSGATFMAYDPPTGLSGSIGSQVEEVKVAPYINVNKCLGTSELYASTGAGGVANIPLFESWLPADWHAAMACDMDPVLALTAQHRANLALYAPNAQLGTYEWGTHWSTIGGPEHDVEVVRSANAAHLDIGMRPLLVEFGRRTFAAMGGGDLHPLTLVARPTHFNAWGFGWYDTDRSASGDDSFRTHPRWLALKDLAASQCAADPLDPPSCTWSTSGAKTTSDSGFSREGIADSDAATGAVTVTDPPAVADLSASCNSLEFFAQDNDAVNDPAPPCQTCSVRNIGQGTLSSTNTLDAAATGWGATRSPTSQTTAAEIDTVTVCVPDPDTFDVGDNLGALTIANSANAGDAQTFNIRYSITNPPQGGDPTWWSGRNGSNQPLVPRGDNRGNVTMVNVSNRATPSFANELGRGMVQYDAVFADSNTEYAMIYNTTFDRQNGLVSVVGDTATDCIPAEECRSNPHWVSSEDVVHLPWNSYRSASTLVAANTFKNGHFYPVNDGVPSCNSSSSCPHIDIIQGDMVNQCPINPATNGTFAFVGNRIGQSDDQDIHWTRWRCAGQRMIVLIQGNRLISSAGYDWACGQRGLVVSNNRDCGKSSFNVPNDGGNQGTPHFVWCIDNDFPIKGGGSGTNAVTAATRVVKVGQCVDNFVGAPTRITYPNVESAIVGEKALGNPIPDFIDASCAGRATPLPGCINTPGDPN